MNIINNFVAIIVIVLLFLIGTQIGTSQSTVATEKSSIIRIFAIDLSNKIDNETGNTSVFAQRLIGSDGNLIGNAFTNCVLIAKGGLFGGGVSQCSGVYNLPRGKITVEGSRRSRNKYALVVTGGSGFYSGISGHVESFIFGTEPFREKLTFYIQL